MPILRKDENSHLIYEAQSLGQLIAIAKADQSLIKKFWKSYKGKSSVPADKISGHPMILDEEFQTLKIDFDQTIEVEIRDLVKFD